MSEVPLYARRQAEVAFIHQQHVDLIRTPTFTITQISFICPPCQEEPHAGPCTGTSLIGPPPPAEFYGSLMVVLGGWVFLMSEVPLVGGGAFL